ncbi:MAG: Alpha-galactosidase [Candidatus Uhrbacteria bacterium GW2011_GWF2_39_13]|uniref:Alpha-galactosidase n=1 Tax=Candidatus Uhrbacteria bacterium GW2011_GWF2_39_13 TaxID=1618995 RepID=A0A0G0QSY3_9BACT|nr:MAG: Alpha-galactosidase [Candidatus Uhrbacteria bacterium GW2011_GWF2_39_13]
MPKIVLIGAGGVIFAQNFIKDILMNEKLRSSEIVLMDINAERLKNASIFIQKISEKLGIVPNTTATTDLRKAVHKADYVITLFRAGTLEHQRIEQEIPRKYGVDQVVADTLGPGGVFRGLRTLKALLEVLDAMEQEAPGSYLLNYVNPMSINTIALSKRAKTIKVIGLCHSVQGTSHALSEYIGVDKDKVRYQAAGINHQAFFLKFEIDGKNAYPLLRKAMKNPAIYNKDKVRFEMFRHFGYFPTESSGHGSEYTPYIRKRKDLIDKFCRVDYPHTADGIDWGAMGAGRSGAALEICAGLQKRNEIEIAKLLSGTKEFDLNPSNEYAVQIIKAIELNHAFSANLNVVNRGLISNLPPECSVEVPCLIDGAGIMPCRIENYPEQLAGLNRCMINVQMLAAEGALGGDRRKIFHAIALDPLTAAVCSLDEIQSMTDELFDALKNDISQIFYK